MNSGDYPESFPRELSADSWLLRALIDTVPDPIFCKDREGRFLVANRANCELFATPLEGFLGKTVFEISSLKEFAPLYHADDLAVMSTGHPVTNREEPFTRPDGTRGWFLTSKYPLRNATGQVIGLVGIARDVSEMRRAADELAQTRQRLSDHVENSPLAVLEWQPDFRLQRWSGQADHIFGWHSHEVLGRKFGEWRFVHCDDVSEATDVYSQLLSGKVRRTVARHRNVTRDGRTLHCVWHHSALHDSHGRVVSVLSLGEDVTELVRAERAALDSQRLYQTVVEATATGYLVMDTGGRVLEANSEYIRLSGHRTIESIRGRRITEWASPHEIQRTSAAVAECVQTGAVRNLEILCQWADGREVPIEVNARLIDTTEGSKIIALCRDISARRAALEEQRRMERKMQEAQKLECLGVLAGGIAHDFNNLLTGVLGNASLAAAEVPAGSPVIECIEQIEIAATKAAELCQQMLAYAGKGRLLTHSLQINKLIADGGDLLRASVSKNARLTFELIPGLPPVLGDSAQLRQVILNLVVNASESLRTEGGEIRIRTSSLRVSAELAARANLDPECIDRPFVSIEIVDDGCGIPADVQARVFDPFFSTKFTGRGLGLAAVLGIVRGHAGGIIVESTPGQGSTFRVLLPVDSQPAAQAERPAPVIQSWRGQGTVLLVDDEVTIRRTVAQMVRALGFDVVLAADGGEGIDEFTADPDRFAVVLLDLTMPKLDGVAVFRFLRDLRPGVRVLLMSGYHETEVTSRFGADGPAGFIQKPFRLPDLREKLRFLLER